MAGKVQRKNLRFQSRENDGSFDQNDGLEIKPRVIQRHNQITNHER